MILISTPPDESGVPADDAEHLAVMNLFVAHIYGASVGVRENVIARRYGVREAARNRNRHGPRNPGS